MKNTYIPRDPETLARELMDCQHFWADVMCDAGPAIAEAQRIIRIYGRVKYALILAVLAAASFAIGWSAAARWWPL
jgi:hypothetical protein